MNKPNRSKNLVLKLATVRQLQADDLALAAGGLNIRSFNELYCYSLRGEGCTAPTATC